MKGYILCSIVVFLSLKSCDSLLKCPTDVKVVNPFNSIWFSGTYYRIYKTRTSLYADKKCTTVYFELSPVATIISMKDMFKDAQNQAKEEISSITLPTPIRPYIGYMIATYPSGLVLNMHVVYITYDINALVLIIGCSGKFPRVERHAWILSKQPTVTMQQLEPVFVKLKENGFSCDDLISSYDVAQCSEPLPLP